MYFFISMVHDVNDAYLLINPNGGRNRRNKGDLEDLIEEAKSLGCRYDKTEDLNDLEEKVEASVDRMDDLVIISSGDGGLGMAVTYYINAIKKRYRVDDKDAIAELLPKFLVLPGGTVNVVADNVGVKGNPAGVFSEIMETYRAEGVEGLNVKDRRILEVQEGERQAKYGFMFAKGLVDNYLDKYYGQTEKQKKKKNYGLLRFGSIFARAVGGYFADVLSGWALPMSWRKAMFSCYHHCVTPEHLELNVDGDPVLNYAVREGCSASTNEYLGAFVATDYFKIFGMKPLHAFKDGNPDGKMQVLAGTSPIHKFVRHLPKVWTGEPLPFPKYVDEVANEVTFKPSPGERHRYSLDAELAKSMSETLYVRQGPMVKFATLPAK